MWILVKDKPVYRSDIKNKKQWSAYSIYIIAFMEKGTQEIYESNLMSSI